MLRIEILKQIQTSQLNADPKYYSPGIFPSLRKNSLFQLSHPDDNLFFSVSISYILKTLYNFVSNEEQAIIDDIRNKISSCVDDYTNKAERFSFNFWKKQEHKHFPNGILAHRFNKFQLPDDIDTTCLTHLATDFTIEKSLKTKSALTKHANTILNTIKNGHKELRHHKAYSTWFGEKMPIEFDVCVLSNYLLWLDHYNFQLNEYDHSTIKLLEQTIDNALYLKSPFKSAPEYPAKAIILYHLTRTMSNTPYLLNYKDKLRSDTLNIYNNTTCNFEKLILSSSLKKLNTNISPFNNLKDFLEDSNKFWWFTAGFLSAYSSKPLTWLAPNPAFHFRFTCPAFNLCLLYENMVLMQEKRI